MDELNILGESQETDLGAAVGLPNPNRQPEAINFAGGAGACENCSGGNCALCSENPLSPGGGNLAKALGLPEDDAELLNPSSTSNMFAGQEFVEPEESIVSIPSQRIGRRIDIFADEESEITSSNLTFEAVPEEQKTSITQSAQNIIGGFLTNIRNFFSRERAEEIVENADSAEDAVMDLIDGAQLVASEQGRTGDSNDLQVLENALIDLETLNHEVLQYSNGVVPQEADNLTGQNEVELELGGCPSCSNSPGSLACKGCPFDMGATEALEEANFELPFGTTA